MNKLSRRNFLFTAFGTAVATQFISFKSKAYEGEDDKLFVQIQIEGGFDVVSSLDPFIQGMSDPGMSLYKDYMDSDVKGDQVILGPAAHSILAYASELVVLNGISMRNQDNSHEGCRVYMASGAQGQGKNSHLVAELAGIHGAGPFGIVANNQNYFNNKRSEIGVALTDDLEPSEISADDPRFTLPTSVGDVGPFFGSLNAFINTVKAVDNYNKILVEASKNFNTANSKIDFEVRIAAALASGLSRHAFMNFGGDFVNEPGYEGLDAHSFFEGDHIKKQTKYFERLAKVLSLFKQVQYKESGKSLFDVTTFFVTNEFSRTPHLVFDGKDHNPETNSALIIGRGIKGNQVIGGSHLFTGTSPIMSALPMDFSLGRALKVEEIKDIINITSMNPNIRMLRPENVMATLLDIMDAPQDKFTNFKNPGVKKIPGIKKT